MSVRYPIVISCILMTSVALTTTGCDQAKSVASKAGKLVAERVSKKDATAGGGASPSGAPAVVSKPDPALQKLVDQTADGVVFRKDQPFPRHLSVTARRHAVLTGRFYKSDAFGQRSATSTGTYDETIMFDRVDGKVRYSPEKSVWSFTAPGDQVGPDGKPKPAPAAAPAKSGKPAAAPAPPAPPAVNPLEQAPLRTQAVMFLKTTKGWQAENRSDFQAVSLAQQLGPDFEQLLTLNALSSRTLWFSKRRFKIGDEVVVSTDLMPMLIGTVAKGTCTLKLVAMEAVEGHPCGVFSIKGDYSRKNVPDFSGRYDADVTIQSGKIWCSLLYPVILREETDAVVSRHVKGSVPGGFQGNAKESVTRTWKITKP